jgi:hypothetical protein
MRWLRGLRDRGAVRLSYDTFSLERNAQREELPFAEAAPRYGDALACLHLARRDRGEEGFEALYVALGEALHARKEEMCPPLLRAAVAEAGFDDGFLARATGPLHGALGEEVLDAWLAARRADVFGVPTLRIGQDKVVYGPILSVAPEGDDALALWDQVKGLADRDTFFEMKRWPRDLRPGVAAPQPPPTA